MFRSSNSVAYMQSTLNLISSFVNLYFFCGIKSYSKVKIMSIVKSKKMRILKTLKRKFAILGICSIGTRQTYDKRNKLLIGFLIFGISSILHCVFLFGVAKTFEEYANSIYMTTMTISISAVYSIVVWKTEKLFQFIKGCEQIINESE